MPGTYCLLLDANETRSSELSKASPELWPTRTFRAQFADIENPVVKGILAVERYGWPRAIAPELTTAYVRTVPKGLTHPWVTIPLAVGVGAGGVWLGWKVRRWLWPDASEANR